MAIEVLTPGVVPDDHFYGTCYRCKAKVRFLKEDASRHYNGDQRDGEHAIITCPTVGCLSDVAGYPKKN